MEDSPGVGGGRISEPRQSNIASNRSDDDRGVCMSWIRTMVKPRKPPSVIHSAATFRGVLTNRQPWLAKRA
ncbi:hypothetical protein PoB_000430100 [Plakobranchus ocellatus]|uniref:Uncharacterized protein n=1 Tax=Plakobranchus ocellatus TaxID=259542 RepID=A0AAV3XPU8_9GAST|nr:hypothetical protein PoB_000430100 [Plakobranchus ocellatus]